MAPGGMSMVVVWALAAPGQQASAKLAVTAETIDIMFRQIFIGCCIYSDASLSVSGNCVRWPESINPESDEKPMDVNLMCFFPGFSPGPPTLMIRSRPLNFPAFFVMCMCLHGGHYGAFVADSRKNG
jgi:hypothetical protein